MLDMSGTMHPSKGGRFFDMKVLSTMLHLLLLLLMQRWSSCFALLVQRWSYSEMRDFGILQQHMLSAIMIIQCHADWDC